MKTNKVFYFMSPLLLLFFFLTLACSRGGDIEGYPPDPEQLPAPNPTAEQLPAVTPSPEQIPAPPPTPTLIPTVDKIPAPLPTEEPPGQNPTGSAEDFLDLGVVLAQEGQIQEAIIAYSDAQKVEPNLEISGYYLNYLCWYGSLWQHPAEVSVACEKAVSLDPYNGFYRDSRGIARAMLGDHEGAIEDFTYFVGCTMENGTYPAYGYKRDTWIEKLEAGQNPFDAATLEDLKNE